MTLAMKKSFPLILTAPLGLMTSPANASEARKLFPLLATLKFANGPERLRFEVTTITPEKIADPDGQLFQPPADYHQLDPLPF